MRPLAAALVLLAAAAAAPAAAANRSVTIRNIDFGPRTVHIHAGDTVRWLFRDGRTQHNVTSRGRRHFRSSRSRSSGTFAVRFAKRGTYSYVCTIHANMRGKVIVG